MRFASPLANGLLHTSTKLYYKMKNVQDLSILSEGLFESRHTFLKFASITIDTQHLACVGHIYALGVAYGL